MPRPNPEDTYARTDAIYKMCIPTDMPVKGYVWYVIWETSCARGVEHIFLTRKRAVRYCKRVRKCTLSVPLPPKSDPPEPVVFDPIRRVDYSTEIPIETYLTYKAIPKAVY